MLCCIKQVSGRADSLTSMDKVVALTHVARFAAGLLAGMLLDMKQRAGLIVPTWPI